MHPQKGILTRADSSVAGRLAVWLATGLGIGLVTPAPGTVAGLWGVGLAAGVGQIGLPGVQAAVIAALVLAAVPLCGVAARALGSKGDPGAIVLDEIVALPIVFLGAPTMSWPILAAGYALFRLCDVAKPGLVRSAERLPGGWGIVADDCVAAMLAWLLLRGVLLLDAKLTFQWLATSA